MVSGTEAATTPAGCNCGCGKDRATVVREIMSTECLNEDQADYRLDMANAARARSAQ